MLAAHLVISFIKIVYFPCLKYSSEIKCTDMFLLVDIVWNSFFQDVDETILNVGVTGPGPSSSGRHTENGANIAAPSVPLHSLAAFGLFLRLPGYAEVLLKDKRKAQCLLRLVLGVTDDGEGGK